MPLSTVVRRVARPLLGSIFVYGGLDAFRHPAAKAPSAETLIGPVTSRTAGIASTERVVRIDGAAKILGGLALGVGMLPRSAALGLATSLVPTTLAGHRFWAQTDPAARATHQLQFIKNASILGGLLLAAAGPERAPARGSGADDRG